MLAAGAGNPSPAAADPTVIKLVNPEAAPSYRSGASPTPGPSPTSAAAAAPQTSPASTGPLPSLSGQVNRLDLTDRGATLRNETADVFDYQGDANREDHLSLDEATHAAEAQLRHRNTALDNTPSAAGANLNIFRQQDLELGNLRQARPS
jgi:hypothetical protein